MAAMAATAVFSIVLDHPAIDMHNEEMADAVTGRLKPKHGPSDAIVFQIGPDAKAWFTLSDVPTSPELQALGSYIQFIRNRNGDLDISTVIRDRTGHMLVEIVDNEWRISNAAWEKNYSDDALE